MSKVETDKTEIIEPETICQYLLTHPDFFINHPEVLRQIQVPHISGDAVSLVQKQVSLLREKNEQAQKRLNELVEIAKQNEELARRMHLLALTLMDAAEPKDIFHTLYENLRQNFRADHVAVRLFAAPSFIDTFAGIEFAGTDMPEQSLFKTIIDKRMPLSGHLKSQQQAFLFGVSGDDIGSAVLVPLHGKGWSGVLAIGSMDASHFTESMGVELLANLGEILSYILKPWIVEK